MDITAQLAGKVVYSWGEVSSLWIPMAWTFFILFSICYPLEMLFPARKQRFLRKGWATDFVFFLMQHSVVEGFMLTLFTAIAASLFPLGPVQNLHGIVSQLPGAVQFLLVILCGDALGYWYHRAMHSSSWLWPFHAVHHSVEEPDWLSAHREHPIDLILGSFCVTLPFILLGVSMNVAMPLILFRGFWSLYIHSNLSLSIGPLQMLLGSPQLHRWHHSLEDNKCNYSNYSPWLDVLFGTYRAPKTDPERFGIKSQIPLDFVSYCVHPFKQMGKKAVKLVQGKPSPVDAANRNITRYSPKPKRGGSISNPALNPITEQELAPESS